MNVSVYLGSSDVDKKYEIEIRKVAKLLVSMNFHIVYGASYLGLMGAFADEVIKNNGYIIGVEVEKFYNLGYSMKGLNEMYVEKNFSDRRNKMIELSDAYIALPGGIGTIDEISEVMCLLNLYFPEKKVIIYNYDGFYDFLYKQLEFMVNEGFISKKNFDTYHFVNTIDELKELLEK